jgi:hypothetical protein
MKICPKCHSSYSDETLNFCLTDGVPLVVEEVYQERLSSQNPWQEAETLHDSRFIAAVSEHTTSPNSVTPTFISASSQKTATFSTETPPKSSKKILFAVIAILLAGGIAAAIFWRSANQTNGANKSQTAAPTATVIIKKAVEPLTDAQQNQVKKEVSETLEDWRASINRRDIERHITHYMQTLEEYYKESGIDKNHVRADRQRAFDRYESISLQVDNLQVTPESTESATAVFDKSWTFKNTQRTATGSVQQEMHLVKVGGKWLINGEKDLKVYFLNNRDNPIANANQAANSAANSASNQ